MQVLAAAELFCSVDRMFSCEGCGMKMHSQRELDAHGTGCMKARAFSHGQRKKLAKSGKALPGGGFPIVNRQDLSNARHAIGRATNPAEARAHIRQRARALGVKLPSTWKAAGCGGGCGCADCSISVGDAVTADGLRGRGVVAKRTGTKLTIQFRNGWEIVRDQHVVHKI